METARPLEAKTASVNYVVGQGSGIVKLGLFVIAKPSPLPANTTSFKFASWYFLRFSIHDHVWFYYSRSMHYRLVIILQYRLVQKRREREEA